ncbi:hypothetical protein CEDDRAFT_03245 [Frankia sp. CeD]|nr:hypothetical protein CEDDRAFT_03245 [Frankia sp. CeD]
MSNEKHPGWTPSTLRRFREARGLTQDGSPSRCVVSLGGESFTPPAATAEMVRRHELGKVFPGVAYRRAYCLLFAVTEPELGFRPAERLRLLAPHRYVRAVREFDEIWCTPRETVPAPGVSASPWARCVPSRPASSTTEAIVVVLVLLLL